jgi:hypothetical protein
MAVKPPEKIVNASVSTGSPDLSRLSPEGQQAAEALRNQGYQLHQTATLAPRNGEWPYSKGGTRPPVREVT